MGYGGALRALGGSLVEGGGVIKAVGGELMAPGGGQWGWDPPFQLWVQLLLWGLLLGRLLRYGWGWGGKKRGEEEEPPQGQL